MTLFLITWFFCGLVSCILVFRLNKSIKKIGIRGKDIAMFTTLFLLGYASLSSTLLVYIQERKKK